MPENSQLVFSWLKVFTMSIETLQLPLQCVSLHSFATQLVFAFVTPLVLAALACICALYVSIGKVRHKKRSGRNETVLRVTQRQVAPFLLGLLFLAFPVASSLAFNAFACDTMDDGSAYLRHDLSVECHSPQYRGTVLPLAWLVISTYAFGIPLFFLLLLLRARSSLLSGHYSHLTILTTFLWSGYKRTYYWFEIPELARKLFFVGFALLISPGSITQLVVCSQVQHPYPRVRPLARAHPHPYPSPRPQSLSPTATVATPALTHTPHTIRWPSAIFSPSSSPVRSRPTPTN